MLKHSFIFLPGIGLQREQSLWQQGITNWDEFIRKTDIPFVSPFRKKWYDKLLAKAAQKLLQQDAN